MDNEAHRSGSVLREYLEALIVAAIFLGFTNTFVLKTFYIPSPSMVETLLVGDHLFVNRFVFGPQNTGLERTLLPGREVRRGDIVIFRSPETPEIDLVKRCVALAGDTVEVRNKSLHINGEAVEDQGYAQHVDGVIEPRGRSRLGTLYGARDNSRDNWGPFQVPDEHLFCMGDNRDRSYDSRYFGPIPMALVKGRAGVIYWSYGGETPDGSWPGWGERLKQLGKTALGFLPKTRWSRTFKLVR
jgi:signal peptidase I